MSSVYSELISETGDLATHPELPVVSWQFINRGSYCTVVTVLILWAIVEFVVFGSVLFVLGLSGVLVGSIFLSQVSKDWPVRPVLGC